MCSLNRYMEDQALDIHFKQINEIGVLELDRSPANCLSIDFLVELANVLEQIEVNQYLRSVIITSSNTYVFSSGLDLKNLMSDRREKMENDVYNAVFFVYQIAKSIMTSKKIFIGALSGAVIGSAVSIALACDILVGTADTWLWLPDPQYGGLLADGGLDLLVSHVGVSRAKIAALTNQRINSPQLLEWGLLYKIVKAENLYETAFSEAGRLSRLSSQTLRYTKQLINENVFQPFKDAELRRVLRDSALYDRLQHYISHSKGESNVVT